jgi:hypothetical protein
MLKSVLKEPLLHFLAAGALLFLLYGVLDQPGDEARFEVAVTPEVRASIESRFQRVWGRAPSVEELRQATDAWTREEMLYQEGVALGLSEGDPVLRGRIAQKMLMVAEASARSVPREGELEAYFEEHGERYRMMPRYTLEQVFFSGDSADARLADALERLRRGGEPVALGDPTLLPQTVEGAAASYVAGVFGEAFTAALESVPVGDWHGPLPSTFGRHLVRVAARSGGGIPELSAVRERVLQDWVAAQKQQARDDYVAALRERYRVTRPAAAGDGNAAAAPPA